MYKKNMCCNRINKAIVLLIACFYIGCVVHKRIPIVVVRNGLTDTIGVLMSDAEIKINDSIVYNTPFHTYLSPNEEREITFPNTCLILPKCIFIYLIWNL